MTNELGINDINIVSLRVYLEDPSRNLSRHLRTLASIWKYAVLYGIGGGEGGGGGGGSKAPKSS